MWLLVEKLGITGDEIFISTKIRYIYYSNILPDITGTSIQYTKYCSLLSNHCIDKVE